MRWGLTLSFGLLATLLVTSASSLLILGGGR